MPAFHSRFRPWIALAILAFTVRLAAVLALQSYAEPFTYEHGEIAKNLLAGRGFTVRYLGQDGPTSQQAPLYPAMLAAAYAAFGQESPAAHFAIQLLQCLAGAATALAVVWLTRSLLTSARCSQSRPEELRVLPWLAGLSAALYPPHVYAATHVQIVPWATLLLTFFVAVCVSPRFAGRIGGGTLSGLLAGLMLLFEPILAIATPLVALAFLLTNTARSLRVRTLAAAWMASVAAAVTAPWLWRNYQVHGEFVFVKSSFGYALWQGNNSLSHGTDKIPKAEADAILAKRGAGLAALNQALWRARHETIYIDDVLLKPHGYREFVGLTEPQRSRLLGARAVDFIRDNPARYAALSLLRLRYFLLWDDTNPKTRHVLYRASTVVWLVLFAGGLIAAWKRWRAFWPTWAIFAAVGAFHVLTITSARFRIPLEPLTFPTVALGAAWMLHALTILSRRGARRGEIATTSPTHPTTSDSALPVGNGGVCFD